VLAPGGGWVTNPGVLEALPAWTTVVWLRISPEEAVRRARRSRTRRPLLAGPGALARARRLLIEREPAYRSADYAVDVEGRNPNSVATDIAAFVRSQGTEWQRTKKNV
jgi:shikimate kinase